ncbi:MAG: DMT family transporter [Flavobacteriales bacterium]|jgi:drug/metabolite transporter (DMT)-like permease|nr:DMT family transporter [Flavobacteriales bacterium]
MQSRRQALVLLHVTVFIWGWTGILGKLIDQDALPLVYVRTWIAAAGLVGAALWLRRSLDPRGPGVMQYLLTSVLIAAHWYTFYLAIKISTAGIAAACLATSTVFTALLEPFWFKRRVRGYEVALGVVVIAALLMIFGLESGHRMGIAIGTLSALLSAWFNVVNGVLVQRDNAVRIGFYEMVGAGTVVGLVLLLTDGLPPPLWHMPADDILWHLLLGLVCTSFAFVAGIAVMRLLSPFTVVLAVNLEPVYTIIIALLIWKGEERLDPLSYLGTALILLSLFGHAWWQRRRDRVPVIAPDPLAQG